MKKMPMHHDFMIDAFMIGVLPNHIEGNRKKFKGGMRAYAQKNN